MSKQTYFVNVQAKSIVLDAISESQEWQIIATPLEVTGLRNRFEQLQCADEAPMSQFFKIGIGSDTQVNEAEPEKYLREIYEQIYHLGTSDTRHKLEQMGLLMI